MNRFIKEQLNKCKVAEVPVFDENTTTINILRKNIQTSTAELRTGQEFDVEVEDYIIHPYPGFTLHDNWNKGIIPTDKQMRITVLQEMGKMIRIKGTGINDKKEWEGWLPKKSCKRL